MTEFYQLSDNKDSFFGIKKGEDSIQFTWEDEDKWLIDVPYDMKNFICLQKFSDYNECYEIIKSIYEGAIIKEIKNLIKVNIMTNNIDSITNPLKRKTRFLLDE